MTGKELAEILMQNPDKEVKFQACEIDGIIDGTFIEPYHCSIDKKDIKVINNTIVIGDGIY